MVVNAEHCPVCSREQDKVNVFAGVRRRVYEPHALTYINNSAGLVGHARLGRHEFQVRGDERGWMTLYVDSRELSDSTPVDTPEPGTLLLGGIAALGGLGLSAADVLARDLYVVEQLRARNIPVVMLLSGGYSQESYRLVANTMVELLRRYGDAPTRSSVPPLR